MGYKVSALINAGAALAMGALLAACLDIPGEPDTSPITKVSVYVLQGGIYDSTLLKVNTNDSASIIAKVYPGNFQKEVSYYWYCDSELVDSGSAYSISSEIAALSSLSELFLPNKVVVRDNEGNEISKAFSIVMNTPPVVLESTTPADGDTLYGNESTAFLFQWTTYDSDSDQGIENTLEIDGERYSVGNLMQVRQSGFSEGRHTFRVFTSDTYGDSDSTSLKTFTVIDTIGATK